MIEAWHDHTSSYSSSICHSICHHYHVRITRFHRWISRFINLLFSFNTSPQTYRTAVNLNNWNLVCWASWLGWLAGLNDRRNVLLVKNTYSCFETWNAKLLSLACTKGLIASEHRLCLMTVHAPSQRDANVAALNWDAKLLNRWPDQTELPASVSSSQQDISVASLNWDAKSLEYNSSLRILTDLQNWSPSIIQRNCITHLLLILYERAFDNIIQYSVSSTSSKVWTTL
jgi:hypothetical protein